MTTISNYNYNEDILEQSIQGEWDILKEGKSLLTFQSFLSFEEISKAKHSQYSLEENSFTTVNKVLLPKEYMLSLALQGLEYELMQKIKILEKELVDTSVIQIITPYGVTSEASLIEKKISRHTKNGLGLLIVQLKLQEIHFSTSSSVSSTSINLANARRLSDVSFIDLGRQSVKTLTQSFSSFF